MIGQVNFLLIKALIIISFGISLIGLLIWGLFIKKGDGDYYGQV